MPKNALLQCPQVKWPSLDESNAASTGISFGLPQYGQTSIQIFSPLKKTRRQQYLCSVGAVAAGCA
jgi:hypothetical protein